MFIIKKVATYTKQLSQILYKIEKEGKILLGKIPEWGDCQPWGLYEITRQPGFSQNLAGLTHGPTAPPRGKTH